VTFEEVCPISSSQEESQARPDCVGPASAIGLKCEKRRNIDCYFAFDLTRPEMQADSTERYAQY